MKTRFNRFHLGNRWKQKYPSDSWTIIGLSERWAGPYDFNYKISLFGIDFVFWFKRTENQHKNK